MRKSKRNLPALIEHHYEGIVIQQRAEDGYINATAMCKAEGKLWGHYWETPHHKNVAAEIAAVIGITITELIQSLTGGRPELQGTWIHPYAAGHLAQWCSTKLAARVSVWMWEWQSGQLPSEVGAWAAIERLANVTHGQMEGIKTDVGELGKRITHLELVVNDGQLTAAGEAIKRVEEKVDALVQKKNGGDFGKEAKEIWRRVIDEHGGYDPSLPGKVKILDENGEFLLGVRFDHHVNSQKNTVWDGWPVNSQEHNIKLRDCRSRAETWKYVDIFHERIKLLYPDGHIPNFSKIQYAKKKYAKYLAEYSQEDSLMNLPPISLKEYLANRGLA